MTKSILHFSLPFSMTLLLLFPMIASDVSGNLNTETSRYLIGVVYDNGDHRSDLWQRGARAITFELKWRLYQPSPGIYDEVYISQMKQLMRSLKRQGWTVQLVPGYHYAPQWVFDNYPNAYYVNQYGQRYDPDPVEAGDFRIINAPFNPQARALISAYLARIFQDFDQSDPELAFDSVRVGGGPQGELRYPPATWDARTNSYWAFDSHAQDPQDSGIPANVVGWRPGIDSNPGTEGRGQLLVNPGFERQEQGFPVFAWSPDDEVTVTVIPDGHSGQAALQLVVHTNRRTHQFVRVEPGTEYELGGWLMSGGASGDGQGLARIVVTQYDAGVELLTDTPFTKLENGDGTWGERSGTLTASPETHFLKFELDGDRPGTYYFDDVWLRASGETNMADRDIDVPFAFYTWYVDSLASYQSWQIEEIRKHYAGRLDAVYAGKGVSANQITDALTNDLRGDSKSEASSGLYSGSDYASLVGALPDVPMGMLALYLTGIEVPPKGDVDDYSPYPSEWSAARWLAHLARQHTLLIWGENSGKNNREEMELSFERMSENGFFGLLWAFSSELYSGEHASADDFETALARYANERNVFFPQVLIP